jgi:hypothetical protein
MFPPSHRRCRRSPRQPASHRRRRRCLLSVQVATSSLGPLRFWARALLTTPCCYGCSEQASAAAAGARLVAWTSRSDSWNETGASHVPRHVLRQAPRTAVKDNQGRRQDVLPRRHGHDRTTSWPDSPRGSLTAPLAASGVLPICPLPIWAFCISRCQSACSSPTAHGSSCTCVAESITHATYNRPESVPGPHSVRQSVYEKNGPKLQVATCMVPIKSIRSCGTFRKVRKGTGAAHQAHLIRKV